MRSSRRISVIAIAGLLTAISVVAAPTAGADTFCNADVCVIDNTFQTPVGVATVTVTAGNVATVSLATTSPTFVFGVPFTFPEPPVAGCPGGCARTSITTTAGTINIDTVVIPPGPPGEVRNPQSRRDQHSPALTMPCSDLRHHRDLYPGHSPGPARIGPRSARQVEAGQLVRDRDQAGGPPLHRRSPAARLRGSAHDLSHADSCVPART